MRQFKANSQSLLHSVLQKFCMLITAAKLQRTTVLNSAWNPLTSANNTILGSMSFHYDTQACGFYMLVASESTAGDKKEKLINKDIVVRI